MTAATRTHVRFERDRILRSRLGADRRASMPVADRAGAWMPRVPARPRNGHCTGCMCSVCIR